MIKESKLLAKTAAGMINRKIRILIQKDDLLQQQLLQSLGSCGYTCTQRSKATFPKALAVESTMSKVNDTELGHLLGSISCFACPQIHICSANIFNGDSSSHQHPPPQPHYPFRRSLVAQHLSVGDTFQLRDVYLWY